jgi:hypothetical protein
VAGLRAAEVYFRRQSYGWLPGPSMLAAWHAAGAARGLPPGFVCADPQGFPTALLLGLWRTAFPGVHAPRPNEPMVTREGRASEGLMRTWGQFS